LAYGNVLKIGVHEWHGVLLWLGFSVVAGLVRESVKLQIASILSFEEAVACAELGGKSNLESLNDSPAGDGKPDETLLRKAVADTLENYRGNSKFTMFWPGSGHLGFHRNAKSLVSLFSQEIWARLAATLCLIGAIAMFALELPVKW
jgi:hypothetical protein